MLQHLQKVVVTGVEQNLIPRLKACGYSEIMWIDKHPANAAILRGLNPDITDRG